MKNLNLVCLCCMCLFMSGAVFSQGLYLKAGGAYRLGLPATSLGYNYTYTSTNSGYIANREGIYGSFGKGVEADVAIGVKGENLGIEVGGSYLLKSSTEMTSKYIYTSASSNSTYLDTYESTMMAISPCFVFATSVGFYGRAGAIIGIPKLAHKEHYVSSSYTSDMTIEYSGNMALGFTGAVGIAVGGGGLKLYIEADFVSLTWAPARSEYTEYKVNGIDQLVAMTTSQKKTNYSDTYSYNSNIQSNPNVESTSLKEYLPYSSVGLKAGIMIGF
jgi:hypothetical protein